MGEKSEGVNRSPPVNSVAINQATLFERIRWAAPMLMEVVEHKKKGAAGLQAGGWEPKRNHVWRSELQMAVNTSWMGVGQTAAVHVDIAPFDSSRFMSAGPARVSNSVAVRDVAGSALVKQAGLLGVEADETFVPDELALKSVDWWAMYPLAGFTVATLAKFAMSRAGVTLTTGLDTFVDALKATYPAPGHNQGVNPISDVHPGFDLSGLVKPSATAYSGLTATRIDHAHKGHIRADRVSIWVPSGRTDNVTYHAIAWLGHFWHQLEPDFWTQEMIGCTDNAHTQRLTLRDLVEALDLMLAAADRMHAAEDQALARMLFVQGMGGAVRVHSGYTEGGLLRKASRAAVVAPSFGAGWLIPYEATTAPGLAEMAVTAPTQTVLMAGWMLLAHTLVLQQAVCQAGPLAAVYNVAPADVLDVQRAYAEAGITAVVSSAARPEKHDAGGMLAARLSLPECAAALRSGLGALYGAIGASECAVRYATAVATSNARARLNRAPEADDAWHAVHAAGVGHYVAFLDRFVDPEIAVGLGLPENHAAVLAGHHSASKAQLVSDLMAGGDVRNSAILTAMAVVAPPGAVGHLPSLRLRPERGRTTGYLTTHDGVVHRVPRCGLALSHLTWAQHGRLPPYHSLGFLDASGLELDGYLIPDENLSCSWVRTGGVATVLAVVNPRAAPATAAGERSGL
nr:MAG TPA: hypothetical protein [Bacteriophage sp.]